MKNGLIKILLLALLFCGASEVWSQELRSVRFIGQNEGLYRREIHKVARDANGFFYFFMNDRIQKYNGESFSNIQSNILRDRNIRLNRLQTVEMDSAGVIYLQFDLSKRIFKIDVINHEVIEDSIQGIIFKDLDNIKIVNTDKRSIICSDIDGKNVFSVPRIATNSSVVSKVFQDDNGIILQCSDKNIYKTDSFDKSPRELPYNGELINNQNGLYLFNPNGIHKWDGQKFYKIRALSGPNSHKLKVLRKDSKGRILAIYIRENRYVDKMLVLNTDDTIIDYKNVASEHNLIKDVFSEDFYNKWMTVGHNCAEVLNFRQKGAKSLHTIPNLEDGKFGYVIAGFLQDKDDKIIFTREAPYFRKLDPITLEYSTFVTPEDEKEPLSNRYGIWYAQDSSKIYSMGYNAEVVYESYLRIIDPDFRKEKRYFLPGRMITIFELPSGNLLIGGELKSYASVIGNLVEFDIKSGTFSTLPLDVPSIESITKNPFNGDVLLSTKNGIVVLDANLKDVKKRILGNTHFRNITAHGNNLLLHGLQKGLIVLDGKSYKVLKILNEDNNLTNFNIAGIIPDQNKNLWISTFNGINVLDSSYNIIRRFMFEDGLVNREFNKNCVFEDREGYLYFGSINGIQRIDPNHLLKWNSSHGFNIDRIIAYYNNREENVDITDCHIFNNIDSLAIHYTLPNYNRNWSSSKSLLNITSNVPVKKSENTLTIKEFPLEGIDLMIKSPPERVLKRMEIKVKRYIPTSIIFGTLGVIGISVLIFYYLNNVLQKEHDKKVAINKRIADLQMSSLQAQMNPHFVFNSLGAIQYFIQTNETDKADEYLTDFAMLMRKILESSRVNTIPLSEEVALLKLYTSLEQVRFENKFDYEFYIDPNIDLETRIPPMIIEPYIENAINHGICNLKDRKGHLSVRFEEIDDQNIKCTIEDNGIGREAAKKFRNKKHKSRGMSIVKDRIALMKEVSNLDLKVDVKDRNENGKVTGTRVTILLNRPNK